MPFDQTCSSCWNHGDSRDGIGQCRAMPPSVAAPEPPAWVLTPVGLARQPMTYIRTADTLPACSHFRPLVEPELPVVESKAERIERLKREGVTDLASFARALAGR